MKLNDIIAEFQEIESLIVEAGGEITPEVEEMLNENTEVFSEKLDKYENLKRYLKGQVEYLKKQEEHYKKRRNTLSNTIKWLAECQAQSMTVRGAMKLNSEEYSYSIRKTESVDFDYDKLDKSEIDSLIFDDLAEYTLKLDKSEIKKHYKRKGEIPKWMEISEKWSVTAR